MFEYGAFRTRVPIRSRCPCRPWSACYSLSDLSDGDEGAVVGRTTTMTTWTTCCCCWPWMVSSARVCPLGRGRRKRVGGRCSWARTYV